MIIGGSFIEKLLTGLLLENLDLDLGKSEVGLFVLSLRILRIETGRLRQLNRPVEYKGPGLSVELFHHRFFHQPRLL
jgi:hypothetical protein